MKAVLLAGGMGTRISEETHLRPKPMIEIGGKPILWHVMKIYSAHGINEFVICLGYRGYLIKEYFANYYLHTCDVTFDMVENSMQVHESYSEPWKVTLVDTGDTTMTGGRIKRALPYVGDEDFCLTYGDGVSDVDISGLIEFHREQGTRATMTAVQPAGRYGAVEVAENRVRGFREKPQDNGGWINGGFFVLSPSVGEHIAGDDTTWEREPLETLAREGELACYRHEGFWYAMDTVRDRNRLEDLWSSDQPPWRTWE